MSRAIPTHTFARAEIRDYLPGWLGLPRRALGLPRDWRRCGNLRAILRGSPFVTMMNDNWEDLMVLGDLAFYDAAKVAGVVDIWHLGDHESIYGDHP